MLICSRKLFKKAQLESRRINGQQAGNAEIISGIRNINDPDNFFAGLARINKDLNQNGARFTITPEGKVILNSAHVIDPMEFSSMSSSDRVGVLSGLPELQPTLTVDNFDTKKSFINNWFVNFIRSNVKVSGLALTIATDIVKTNFDMDTLTCLLGKYTEELIRILLELLFGFLQSVKDVLINDFKEVFPFVSFPVGSLQFIMKVVTEMSESLGIPLPDFLKTCFNNDGTINKAFAEVLLNELQLWIITKLTQLRTQSVGPFIQGRKIRKDCDKCKGYFFQTENN